LLYPQAQAELGAFALPVTIVVLLIKNGEDSADTSADRLNSDLIGLFKEALRDADVD